MGSIFDPIKKIFKAIGAGISWLFKDETSPRGTKYSRGTTDGEKADSQPERKEYPDPWEELDYIRTDFFLGRWVARKFRPIGEDKVKAELAKLEKKREEKKLGQEQGQGREAGQYRVSREDKLLAELEAAARQREEKQRRKEEKKRGRG